ncbi:MAG: hypothetical protein WA999_19915 [Spirulinaceae cyanobacterium]
MFKNSHQDPPGLWGMVALGSLAIHGLCFWLLWGLFLPNRAKGDEKATIPIDIIAVKANQSPVDTPKASIPPQKPPTIPNSKQIPTLPPQPNQPPTPSPSPTLSPSTSPTPTPKPRVSPNPTPNPTPSPGLPEGNQGFTVKVGRFERTATNIDNPGQDVDTIDQPATIKPNDKALFKNLNALNLPTKQPLTFEVIIIVETNGKANVEPNSTVIVQQGNISPAAAQALATEILQDWEFNPTVVEGGFVAYSYHLQLSTNPF